MSTEDALAKEMLSKRVWAVVGANPKPEKYGNKIYRKLKSKGYEVFAVNPTIESLEGDRVYPDLKSLPRLPDVVNMVVSPQKGLPVLEEAARLGVKDIWLQPGTYDDTLMTRIDELGLEALRSCVLIMMDQAESNDNHVES